MPEPMSLACIFCATKILSLRVVLENSFGAMAPRGRPRGVPAVPAVPPGRPRTEGSPRPNLSCGKSLQDSVREKGCRSTTRYSLKHMMVESIFLIIQKSHINIDF